MRQDIDAWACHGSMADKEGRLWRFEATVTHAGQTLVDIDVDWEDAEAPESLEVGAKVLAFNKWMDR